MTRKLQGESVVVLPVCRILHSIFCARQRATSFTHVWEGDKPVDHFARSRPYNVFVAERFSCRGSGVPAQIRDSVGRSCGLMYAYFQPNICSLLCFILFAYPYIL